MLRLPRLRGLDPELTSRVLPFYLRPKWLVAQAAAAVAAQFLWAWLTSHGSALGFRARLELSVSVFVLACSVGYFYARLATRFLGVSWINIRRGRERLVDTWLGRATLGCGLTLIALPPIINGFLRAEFLVPVPFYSGAVVGSAFAFLLWVIGLPSKEGCGEP
ncbi:hypothetical protein FJZ36_07490 [Candidatus Poribacteria bacterium]|nr:hypothetical protein [Candidatus Poribacteria bacterium]